jgi:DNA-binding CsgD family transcriptional regulator
MVSLAQVGGRSSIGKVDAPRRTNGATAPTDHPDPRERLSARELEVLAMTSSGCTNSEIAEKLEVTIHAVKFHLGSVYRKLGVANRTEAAVAYLSAYPAGTDRGGAR